MKKLLLRNGNLLGDTLALTCGVRDLKNTFKGEYQVKVQTNYMEVWQNNTHLDIFDTPDEVLDVGLKIVTNGSKTNQLHITNGLRLCLEDRLKVHINQGICKPEIYLTDIEKNNKVITEKYWIINTEYGNQASETKRWHEYRFQEIVDKLSWITFVQTGSNNSGFKVIGNNVIDFVGKTRNLRDLFSLFYNCEGVICLIGGNAHIAGAFQKPAVVIAGANEPSTFEAYPFQRYLSNIGAIDCSLPNGCWKCKLGGCKHIVNGIPLCKEMITSDDVVKAVESYYIGGKLVKPENSSIIEIKEKPLLKVISNSRIMGGAEKSVIEIIKMAQERDYRVELLTPHKPCEEFINKIPKVKITDDLTGKCDTLLLYASDMVFNFHKPEFEPFNRLQAKRKVMALTYKIGKTGELEWTKNWDKYLFLCSDLKDSFLKKYNNNNTKVLPPPVDLQKFYEIEPDYNKEITLLRHSSQGDSKYSKDINTIIDKSKARFYFMPRPSFIEKSEKTVLYNYNELPIEKFLSLGNCFWYLLPEGYTDQGPRVIMEAMASGLPVIAENRDGAKDRIDSSCGWLINSHEEAIDIINSLTPEILREKGLNARNKVKQEFNKENWIKEILGV